MTIFESKLHKNYISKYLKIFFYKSKHISEFKFKWI
jgi:hypothetical protein